MNLPRPYVGVSGVSNIIEAQKIRDLFLEHNFSSSGKAQGAIGLCLTADILKERQAPPPRYIVPQLLNSFFELPQDFGFICIHYTPDALYPLEDQIAVIVENIGVTLPTLVIQINNFIPQASTFENLKATYPFIKFILQISSSEELVEFGSCFFSVLLDESRVTGRKIDVRQQIDSIETIHQMFSKIEIGVAGGMKAENLLETLHFFVRNLNNSMNVSIDAESGLRDEKDKLSMKEVKKYISEASKFYG